MVVAEAKACERYDPLSKALSKPTPRRRGGNDRPGTQRGQNTPPNNPNNPKGGEETPPKGDSTGDRPGDNGDKDKKSAGTPHKPTAGASAGGKPPGAGGGKGNGKSNGNVTGAKSGNTKKAAAVRSNRPPEGKFSGTLINKVPVIINGDYGADHAIVSE